MRGDNKTPSLIIMSDIKNMGIPIVLDCERNLIFNLNVLEQCIEKYGSLETMLNQPLQNISATKWLAVAMLNEDAEMWNEVHTDNQKPLLNEKSMGRYIDGIGGINDFQGKVREAILKGLPTDKVAEVEEIEKNLIAVQSGMTTLKKNRAQRRIKK